MSKISRTRGKNAELAVARVLSAKRNHFEAEDLSHALFSIEVKHRKVLPKSITQWFAQAVRAAPVDKIPCLVMHEERQEYEDCLAVIRLRDLRDLLAKVRQHDTALKLGQFRCWRCTKVIVFFWFRGEVYLQRICPSCKTWNELMLRASQGGSRPALGL